MSVTGVRSRLGITGNISVKIPKRVLKRWQKSWMTKWKEMTRFILRPRVAERVSAHLPCDVEPESRFDFNKFL